MGQHKSRAIDRQRRREQFLHEQQLAARKRLSWNWILIAAGLGFLALLLYVSVARPTPAASLGMVPAEPLLPGQDVRLTATSFADGAARFYRYATSAGREIRFFVLKSSDGVVRAAFDTCDVCYRERRGYHQTGDNMICNNCERAFRSVDVNVISGGCNPAPLERTLDGDQIVITTAALERGAWYF
jgi:uncharacterized membrane protein